MTCGLSTFFVNSNSKMRDILIFMAKIRVNKEDFFKFSTGEIPVSTGPVDFFNRSCQVRYRSRRTGTGLPDRFQLCKQVTRSFSNFLFFNHGQV